MHLRARYYDLTLGVFPSLDPVEGNPSQPLSLGRYGYVQGNPINAVDPSGLFGDNPDNYAGCDNQQGQTNCVNFAPFTVGEVKPDFNTNYVQSHGIVFTVDCCVIQQQSPRAEWNQVQINNVISAVQEVNTRIEEYTNYRFSFLDVFGGLEFRHANSNDSLRDESCTTANSGGLSGARAGLAPRSGVAAGKLVLIGPGLRANNVSRDAGDFSADATGDYGLHHPNDKGIQSTIVHELGHILDYRTRESMRSTASAFNLRALVIGGETPTAERRENFSIQDPTEFVADYFLNWIYDSFLGDFTNRQANAFFDGVQPPAEAILVVQASKHGLQSAGFSLPQLLMFLC